MKPPRIPGWTLHFAWWPVHLEDGTTARWQWVYHRIITRGDPRMDEGAVTTHEYRRAEDA